jgi:hypothetical protein
LAPALDVRREADAAIMASLQYKRFTLRLKQPVWQQIAKVRAQPEEAWEALVAG